MKPKNLKRLDEFVTDLTDDVACIELAELRFLEHDGVDALPMGAIKTASARLLGVAGELEDIVDGELAMKVKAQDRGELPSTDGDEGSEG